MSPTTDALVNSVRLFSGALFVASVPLVIFDSLTKKVDVISLKDKLDLKEARLLAIMADKVGTALAPYMNTDLSLIGLGMGFNPGVDDTYSTTTRPLSEMAKDAAVKSLRVCYPMAEELVSIKGIPNRIASLNQAIYINVVWLAALSGTELLGTFWLSNQELAWGLLVALATTLLSAGVLAVLRQTKVHYAEQSIIHEDPQPRI